MVNIRNVHPFPYTMSYMCILAPSLVEYFSETRWYCVFRNILMKVETPVYEKVLSIACNTISN